MIAYGISAIFKIVPKWHGRHSGNSPLAQSMQKVIAPVPRGAPFYSPFGAPALNCWARQALKAIYHVFERDNVTGRRVVNSHGLAAARAHAVRQVRELTVAICRPQIQDLSGWSMIVVDGAGRAEFAIGFDRQPLPLRINARAGVAAPH